MTKKIPNVEQTGTTFWESATIPARVLGELADEARRFLFPAQISSEIWAISPGFQNLCSFRDVP